MFLIRRIYEDYLPVNKRAIQEVKEIFLGHFPDAPRGDIESLAQRLSNPFLKRFRTILLVAENSSQHVLGFAILLHEPELNFCYLDYMGSGKALSGRGIGGALYEHVRDQTRSLNANGLFFECLPAEPSECADPVVRKQNAARLKFYSNYGVRKILGTQYESPVPGGSPDCLPHLMYDDLDSGKALQVDFVKSLIRAILERKYSDICPESYIKMVSQSVVKPVQLSQATDRTPAVKSHPSKTIRKIKMVINDKHDIHHIRERGYVESPVRISLISNELTRQGLVDSIPTKEYPLKHILAVHDQGLVEFLEKACLNAPAGKSVYPYVFPIRNATRPPKDLSLRAGYYCIDTFTPINRNAYPAARRGVDATMTAADTILAGERLAYALVRPPGHHAERKSFGGFCYFCNAAVAANYFSTIGTVAILDIDYHHGNGQQDIFYERSDVLTVSIHGDPEFAYPYFTGFADERGKDAGDGFNLNLPLPEVQEGKQFRKALAKALKVIIDFDPKFLVICLGLDPAKGYPTGTWSLAAEYFKENGRMIGALNLPTLIVQEGGYRTRTLGVNARNFFQGLLDHHDRT